MVSLTARHQSLIGLGIRQWYSKCVLPNAAKTPESLLCKVEMLEGKSSSMATKSLSGVKPSVPASLESIRLISPVNLVKGSEQKSEPQPVKSVALSDEAIIKLAPALTISALSIQNITFLFEQTYSSNKDVEKALLMAIAGVITGKTSSLNQKSSVLTWPVFESNAFKVELSRYFDLVIKCWLDRQSWSDCDYVFYFGSHLPSLESVLLDIRSEQNLEFRVVPCKASLAQILSSPIKKRNLWELFSHIGVVDA
jgi:hypothetical protein